MAQDFSSSPSDQDSLNALQRPDGPHTDPVMEEKARQFQTQFAHVQRRGEEREAKALAAAMNLPYMDLFSFPIDAAALQVVSEEEARRIGAAPFFVQSQVVRLATARPEHDGLTKLIERLVAEGYTVRLYIVSKRSLERALDAYKRLAQAPKRQKGDDAVDVGVFGKTDEARQDAKMLGQLGDRLKTVPISELVIVVLKGAASVDASDVHIEAEQDQAAIRFRVDGVLQDIATIPLPIYEALVKRFKLLASVKVNVTDEPQDGRFSIQSGTENIDLRFSSLPTAFGESIVVRFLGLGQQVELESLGMRPAEFASFKDAFSASQGLVLVTGPTGSGKTTSLYAALRSRIDGQTKIITLENPVEVRVEGIQQVNIEEEKGMSFAAALRSVLRQDPDVLLVGEIRDVETAETAAQAAQTGHLVFSTLHANDAASSLTRLLSMGVRSSVVVPALTAIVAQRLVRKVVPSSVEQRPLTDEQIVYFADELGAFAPQELIEAARLLASGEPFPQEKRAAFTMPMVPEQTATDLQLYKGRIGLFEILRITDEIRALAEQRPGVSALREVAAKAGMMTMRQDGLLKVLEGVTTLEEVDRVTKR